MAVVGGMVYGIDIAHMVSRFVFLKLFESIPVEAGQTAAPAEPYEFHGVLMDCRDNF